MAVKNKKIKVVVAMSGGVDSSVSAALLKYGRFLPAGRQVDVVGIMMKFWSEKGGNRCCSTESEALARLVAKQIGIPFYVVNVEKEFKKKVVDYFLAEYKAGRTPNPCVVCNKEIKFGFLIKKALTIGADFIATGHYCQQKNEESISSLRGARRRRGNPGYEIASSVASLLSRNDEEFKLLKGADKEKDQSYFLWQLNQKQLSRVMFPVGEYTKAEVRKLAKEFDLPTAETPESQEVCFIQNETNDFLKKYLKIKPGRILDKTGKVLGQHKGLWFYTIGQRRALEIPQGPWYVVDKNFKKNILVVSNNKKDLLKKEMFVKNVNWISGKEPKFPIKVKVKIRYRAKEAVATIFKIKNLKFKILFDTNQKAITPGQSAVFYKGKELLGGGVII